MQRTADPAGRAIAIQSIGFIERVRIHDDGRVQPIFIGGEPHEVLTDERPRGQAARCHRGTHLRDRGFDQMERLGGRRGAAGSLCGKRDRENAGEREEDDGTFHRPAFYDGTTRYDDTTQKKPQRSQRAQREYFLSGLGALRGFF